MCVGLCGVNCTPDSGNISFIDCADKCAKNSNELSFQSLSLCITLYCTVGMVFGYIAWIIAIVIILIIVCVTVCIICCCCTKRNESRNITLLVDPNQTAPYNASTNNMGPQLTIRAPNPYPSI